nr:hypothetical protein [uncultured Rhodopila sp.]
MATNLERFKKDLDRLIEQGGLLECALQRAVWKDGEFEKEVEKQIGKEKSKALHAKIPNFKIAYEPWYSECLALIRQLLPDRLANFVSLYEKPKSRKEISCDNYVIQDYLQGIRVTYMGEVKVDGSAAVPQLSQQVAILTAVQVRFESSLFEISQLVRADLFDSEIDAARDLLKKGFLRAAGAIAGVVIEKHLHQVCADHTINIGKRHPGIGDLNELLKANQVIDVPQWRHISLMADIRNICDHSKSSEPTTDQVKYLLDGASKILKTIF